jgi:hypothetical protein
MPLTLGTFDPCMTKILAMYSGVGTGKFPPSIADNQTRLRGGALNCQRLPKPSDALEAGRGNADEILRG